MNSKQIALNRIQRLFLGLILFLVGCSVSNPLEAPVSPVQEIELAGDIVNGEAQLSGLAWYRDWLILLPQYPDFAGNGSFVYGLHKQAILDYLVQEAPIPLTPTPIPFNTNRLDIFGSQGFEAVDFGLLDGVETAVFTIEAAPWGQMRGYLLRGQMAPDLSQLTLELEPIVEMLPQARQFNMAYEAVLIANNQVLAFYELNGARFNGNPQALGFDRTLQPTQTAILPHIPHRITGVTSVDENGRFWAINYLPRGLNLLSPQPIWQNQQRAIEQLIELAITDTGIQRTATPPINLHGQAGRNWEGIVRLDALGFLLVIDNTPRTMLAFVETPR